jgi:hypothetical protein
VQAVIDRFEAKKWNNIQIEDWGMAYQGWSSQQRRDFAEQYARIVGGILRPRPGGVSISLLLTRCTS